MMTYTKKQAMELARADFAARNFSSQGHVFEVWGGTTKYMAFRDGIYRIKRDDNGGTNGVSRPSVMVVPASKLL